MKYLATIALFAATASASIITEATVNVTGGCQAADSMTGTASATAMAGCTIGNGFGSGSAQADAFFAFVNGLPSATLSVRVGTGSIVAAGIGASASTSALASFDELIAIQAGQGSGTVKSTYAVSGGTSIQGGGSALFSSGLFLCAADGCPNAVITQAIVFGEPFHLTAALKARASSSGESSGAQGSARLINFEVFDAGGRRVADATIAGATVVPEPGTAYLLSLGVTGLLGARRFSRRRSVQ